MLHAFFLELIAIKIVSAPPLGITTFPGLRAVRFCTPARSATCFGNFFSWAIGGFLRQGSSTLDLRGAAERLASCGLQGQSLAPRYLGLALVCFGGLGLPLVWAALVTLYASSCYTGIGGSAALATGGS